MTSLAQTNQSLVSAEEKRKPGRPKGYPKTGGRQKGTPSRNEKFLTSRLREMYGKDFDPVVRCAEAAVELHAVAMETRTVNDLTAKAMQIIFDDEHDHYMEQAKEAISHIKSPEDLERMKDAIAKISEQRVWMRAEMFRDAMTKAEIETFIEENKR